MPLPVSMKPTCLERVAVDDVDAVGHHVGDVEELAVGRGADVLRHAFPRRADHFVLAVRPLDDLGRPAGLDHLRVAQHLAVDQVDLGDGARELAGEDRVAAVDREIGVIDARAARHVDRVLQLPSSVGSRKSSRFIASATTIADLPSGEKYMLYGSSTGIALPGLPVFGSIGITLPLVRVLRVVRDPQRAQVPRRHDVLRIEADLELADDLERRRIDHVDVVATGGAARRRAAGRWRPPGAACRAGLAVEVGGIGHGRHARDRGDRRLAGACAERCAGERARSSEHEASARDER